MSLTLFSLFQPLLNHPSPMHIDQDEDGSQKQASSLVLCQSCWFCAQSVYTEIYHLMAPLLCSISKKWSPSLKKGMQKLKTEWIQKFCKTKYLPVSTLCQEEVHPPDHMVDSSLRCSICQLLEALVPRQCCTHTHPLHIAQLYPTQNNEHLSKLRSSYE